MRDSLCSKERRDDSRNVGYCKLIPLLFLEQREQRRRYYFKGDLILYAWVFVPYCSVGYEGSFVGWVVFGNDERIEGKEMDGGC